MEMQKNQSKMNQVPNQMSKKAKRKVLKMKIVRKNSQDIIKVCVLSYCSSEYGIETSCGLLFQSLVTL